jgi:hypothetical protein
VAMAFCHYLASTDFPSFLKLQIHLVNWFMWYSVIDIY